MRHLQLLCLLPLALLVACDRTDASGDDTQSTPTPRDAAQTPATADAGLVADVSAASQNSVESKPAEPLQSPVLGRAVSPKKAGELVGDTPLGKLSGEAFGADSPVFGVARNACGEGTVLRPIFKRAGSDKLQVGPPIPLDFYNLATGRPVTYERNDFRVMVDVDVDTSEKLKGEVRITYDQAGQERVFAHLVYDGPPIDAVVPPMLEGDGKLIYYPNCYPSGYALATTSDGDEVRGLVRIVDLQDKGAAYSRVSLGNASALQILVVSRNPEKGIDPAQTVVLEAARRTEGDVGVLFDVSYRPELTTPDEAIGANLGTMQKSKVLEGKATVRIWKDGRDRYFDGTFEDVLISEIIEGPLSGKNFESIRVYGRMVSESERPIELPEPPDFYKTDDAASESP